MLRLHRFSVGFFLALLGLAAALTWGAAPALAYQAVLVKNLESFPSDPDNLTNVNGTLFFTANDGIHGEELWKSDGTEAGTCMVKNINTYNPGYGERGSNPQFLTNVNGVLYFDANDRIHGQELWKSDGTETGTYLVKDINPNISTGDYGEGSFPMFLTNVNGTLFFSASGELWKSDGTENGTVKVKSCTLPDNGPYFGSQYSEYDWELMNHYATVMNGTLFFNACDFFNQYGHELWKSDGTPAGTVMVKDIFYWGDEGSMPKY